jgi:hypothetical protein
VSLSRFRGGKSPICPVHVPIVPFERKSDLQVRLSQVINDLISPNLASDRPLTAMIAVPMVSRFEAGVLPDEKTGQVRFVPFAKGMRLANRDLRR